MKGELKECLGGDLCAIDALLCKKVRGFVRE